MLRRAWKPLAATTVLIGTPSYLYYTFTKQQTFELAVKVRGADGKPVMANRTFSLLSKDAVKDRLIENASSDSFSRPDSTVWRYATASVAANNPLEDAHADAIIARDPSDPSAPGDWLFFTVMDGHGGPHTSRLLSKTLISAVVLELSSLIHSTDVPKSGLLHNLKLLFRTSAPKSREDPQNPERISLAIKNAFSKLDQELINAPLSVLAANLDAESIKKNILPDLSQHPLALQTMLPAVSGSCALMAVFDTAHRHLYVACSGDSRAVAGIWEENEQGQGSWRVEVLSEDQTGRNPNELKRIQSEHPPDEAGSVIRAGRVLGGLEPSRAFGDARYKWPRDVQDVLNRAFLVGNDQPLRPPPSSFKTPPYVTATPVVTHRDFDFGSAARPSRSPASRFVVLATDGLWDKLSSEDVVALVGGHLKGLKGVVSKTALPELVPTTSGAPTVEGKDKKRNNGSGSWSFEDENISSHLIRNAFGGGDAEGLRELMSIPAPIARSYRDDTTVTVVWWEDGQEGNAKTVTFSSDNIKAKL
ncbi:phosphatase 2C-like domain-containing protein [Suillus clintonianus]|uniref:phosphatase 2C-like domain-containing protein n=1 Tax=Suillus clintonianus TaxID=1904413 RepID=UPI001B86C4B7|nr:phosphatase 2C-like domain-containing protein [Suillus clintonianus]KAG2156298.1 phosphatase 2C-like domain-containing protein [Suillus clintonianus]